jgi:hypothetical protein
MRNRYALILTVLLALGAGSAVAADSAMVPGFSVTKYGFHFNNYFTGSILISVPLIGQLNFGGTSYGLCGGMSYSVYDDYLYNVAAPSDSTPFAPGTAHRSYVYNRQDDSFKADNAFMIRRFIEWIALPIDSNFATTGLQVRSHRQFKRVIKPALESGKPVVVGLLRADLGDLTTMGQGNALLKNHQVLAVGFSLHTLPNGHQEWDIHIYDPNAHDHLSTLHTAQRMETAYGDSNKTGGFRAFFAIPYSSKKPGWAPASAANPVRSAAFFSTLAKDDEPVTDQELKELNLPPLQKKKP